MEPSILQSTKAMRLGWQHTKVEINSMAEAVFQLSRYPDVVCIGDPEWINGKWYYWDETWVTAYGPFDTEQEAREGLDKYSAQL